MEFKYFILMSYVQFYLSSDIISKFNLLFLINDDTIEFGGKGSSGTSYWESSFRDCCFY